MHDVGSTWAEVTEGSTRPGGVWQRSRYDWSEPNVVRLEVLDSNAFGRGSSWTYRLLPDAEGTRLFLTVHRHPTSVRSRLLDAGLWVLGPLIFGRDLRRSLRRLEQDKQR